MLKILFKKFYLKNEKFYANKFGFSWLLLIEE